MRILLFFSALLLASCSHSPYTSHNYGSERAPLVYTVKKGDTLFSISWRYGMTQAHIMRLNNIANPNRILIGQKLRFYDSVQQRSTVTRKKTTYKPTKKYTTQKGWVWPMRGTVLSNFNPGAIGANGIRIKGKPGQTVNAAAAGTVVYNGNGLNGYGNVVIIKHANGIMSAYGFLSKTYVKKGQRVSKRQKIATVGYAPNKRLMLHFETRSNGKPVNPKQYIGNSYHF